jgi:hypothetical protein
LISILEYEYVNLIKTSSISKHELKSGSSSTVPNVLKQSCVIPKPKVRNPRAPEHFRPINNTPVIEKILEAVVHSQVMDHLKNNNILSDMQFGFREGYSTEMAVQLLIHAIIDAIETNQSLVLVALDLRRAFETVDRNELCNKMRYYGFGNDVIEWFSNFLLNRRQVVCIENTISSPIEVPVGLPQGSKLANLLFLLFINDLPLHLQNAKIILFADDAIIYTISHDTNEAVQRLNDNLVTISDWLKFNSMSLNHDKCNAMIINSSSRAINNIIIDSREIKIVKVIKYLGAYIDDELKLDCHFEKLIGSLRQKIGILHRTSHKLDRHAREIFFKSIILPIIDYNSSLLLLLCDSRLVMIQKLVNKAMRAVLKRDRMSNIDEMQRDLNILPIAKRIQINALVLVQKIISRGMPLLIREKFVMNCETRQRRLRNDNEFKLPAWINSVSRRSIFYSTVDMLNKIKPNEKMSFKQNCITFLNS